MMKEGRAVGGPLDKVKIKASIAWDGTIARGKDVHPGNYSWNGTNWVWAGAVLPPNPARGVSRWGSR